ncbi:MAG: Uma2 family endonuclease [Bacteroidota bacterium]
MYTVFDEDNEKYMQVEEPDPSYSYTYADYLKWKFEERLELFRGKIYKLSAPNTAHQEISGILFFAIKSYFQKSKCKVFSAPFDVRLPIRNKKKDTEVKTVVQPDICVICDESKLDEKGCCGAPDIVIEILSPGNSKKEVRLKFELYEEAGVKEYWIVQPTEETISVSVLNEGGKYAGFKMYAGGDKIKSEAVQGLIIDVKDIFSK